MKPLFARAVASLALAASPTQARSLYVEAGRLLDVETGQVSTGRCLLTQDERIARIEPCSAMVRYGMIPPQAIRSAAIDAATLIGHEGEFGSLKPGKFADMIAVSGDPLADVRVLESVAGVVKGGEWYR